MDRALKSAGPPQQPPKSSTAALAPVAPAASASDSAVAEPSSVEDASASPALANRPFMQKRDVKKPMPKVAAPNMYGIAT